MFRERIEAIEERILRAVARAGRKRSDITLLAVSKTFPADQMRQAYEAGLREFGENYVQEFAAKKPALADLAGAHFHFIGHLQSNKTAEASQLFDVIQTVDSPKIARRLNEGGRDLEVMIEVKLSPEDSKSGVLPEELPALVDAIQGLDKLRLTGLMTMPPWNDDAEVARPYFRKLTELACGHGLGKLSMGMSHDFEVAIEEGATHIRVGRALFGPRVRNP